MSGKHQNLVLKALAGGASWTLDDLDQKLPLSRKQIVQATGLLKNRGLLETLAPGEYQATAQGLAFQNAGKKVTSGGRGPRTAKVKPYFASTRQALWRAMRLQGEFTCHSLLVMIQTEVSGDQTSNVYQYVRALYRAGYLHRRNYREPSHKPTSSGFKVYELIRNSGEIAPAVLRHDEGVLDHNLDKIFTFQDEKEAA